MIYLIVLLPPILFAISNLLDKRLTVGTEADSSPSALMLIGGFFNLVIFLIGVVVVKFLGFSFVLSWPLFLNGIIFSVAIWLYLKVLKTEDTDRVIVWWQTIPIFGLIGASIFLSEVLSSMTVGAIFLVIFGSIVMSARGISLNRKLIAMMLVASLLIAVNDVAFAFWGRTVGVSSAILSDMIGKAFWCLIFVFAPGAIRGFVAGLKTKLGIQSLAELTFVAGDAIFDAAKIFAPVAIVQSFSATQPLFVFVGGLVLAIFYPKFLGEIFEWRHLKNKILGLILVTVGSVILALELS